MGPKPKQWRWPRRGEEGGRTSKDQRRGGASRILLTLSRGKVRAEHAHYCHSPQAPSSGPRTRKKLEKMLGKREGKVGEIPQPLGPSAGPRTRTKLEKTWGKERERGKIPQPLGPSAGPRTGTKLEKTWGKREGKVGRITWMSGWVSREHLGLRDTPEMPFLSNQTLC